MTSKKIKSVFAVVFSIIAVVFVIFGLSYVNIYHYNINSKYTVSDDYQVISYNNFGDKAEYSKIELDGYKPNTDKAVYIGNASHNTKTIIGESLYDDKLYIEYKIGNKVLIRMENDFEDDYYYTNDESILDYIYA